MKLNIRKVAQMISHRRPIIDGEPLTELTKDESIPIVIVSQLTHLTKSQTEILNLHKDVLRPPPQLQVR